MKIKSITRRRHFSVLTTACCLISGMVSTPVLAEGEADRHGMALAATFNPDFLNTIVGSNGLPRS